MTFRKTVFFTLAAVALGTVALAHHIQIALTSPFGTESLTSIFYFADGGARNGSIGVPPTIVGSDDPPFDLGGGDSFTVSDGNGRIDQVVFRLNDFADIHKATTGEVIAAVNAQLRLGRVEEQNGAIVLHGFQGGTRQHLRLENQGGTPLTALGFPSGIISGDDNIDFVLSAPVLEDRPGAMVANVGTDKHTYVLLASTTPGSTGVGGGRLPIQFDGTTAKVLAAARAGLLSGFIGRLDSGSDSVATFDTALFASLFPQGLPQNLYFAYAVLGDGSGTVTFTSNRFDVHIVK